MRTLLQQLKRPMPVAMQRGTTGDVLVLSMRPLAALAGYCMQYEFEDLALALTGGDRADFVDARANELERKLFKLLRSASPSASAALRLTPRLSPFELDRTYDLFLPVFNHAHELYALRAIPGWRKKCRFAACVINELWADALPEYLLETLAEFDRLYVCSNHVDRVARIAGRPCRYFPIGIDAVAFCPLPDLPVRGVDVCGIGRRSPVTHRALLEWSRQRGAFYYFDTIRTTVGVADAARQVTFCVTEHGEHRLKLASLLKRSRYFLASRARANEPERAAMEEMSGRFFEGAAAGTVMLGDPPKSPWFREHFGWPDAVVEMPFDCPDIADRIEALDRDPGRLARIRRDNVVNALSRHDWALRLRMIFDDAGLPPTAPMLARQARLRELADQAKETVFP
jgi:hypothetical protein